MRKVKSGVVHVENVGNIILMTLLNNTDGALATHNLAGGVHYKCTVDNLGLDPRALHFFYLLFLFILEGKTL